ncbi:hypothetical protein [Sphingobacterium sp. LRF_L2]|uniref:hypothetical protein n=1 Tax=Sphingobacterium sp. LRF_L2 TaxID=3369421 RepID=UPI003F5D6390
MEFLPLVRDRFKELGVAGLLSIWLFFTRWMYYFFGDNESTTSSSSVQSSGTSSGNEDGKRWKK